MTKNIEKINMNQHSDYAAEIDAIVESNLAPKLMGQRVLDYHENDIAAALELLPKDARRKLYSVLDTETLAEVLSYAEDLEACIGELPVRKRVEAHLALLKGQPMPLAFGVSFCTGAALLAAMVLSSVVGTSIPILFKKLGIDPAVASGPLITTVNDLVAVTAYYGLAWGLLIGVMGF